MLRRALFASLVPVITVMASCMGATEIVVHVTTNACPALHYTDIWVDGQHVTQATTPTCDPNNPLAVVDVGTITLLPSHGIDSDVKISLVGNVSTATDFTSKCLAPDTPDTECIIARRSLAFNPHQRIDLPILLDNACAGIQCTGDQTCVVDDTGAHCGDSTCGNADSPACVVDAGGPDAPILPDVFVFDGGPPGCQTIVPLGGKPTFSWSFDNSTADGVIHEDNEAFKQPQLSTSTIIAAPPTFCDNPYLRSKSTQTLASSGNTTFQTFNRKSFIAGLAFNAASDAPILALTSSSTQPAGFDISVVTNMLQVKFGNTVVYAGTVPLKLSVWHRFAIEVATSASGTGNGDTTVLTTYLDGAPAVQITTNAPFSPGLPAAFTVGAADVDNVVYYQK